MVKRHTFTLTDGELRLLNHALRNGIGDDAIEHVGLTKREQHRLARVANNFTEAAGQGRPYWEE